MTLLDAVLLRALERLVDDGSPRFRLLICVFVLWQVVRFGIFAPFCVLYFILYFVVDLILYPIRFALLCWLPQLSARSAGQREEESA